ncbi:MAG: glycosyltransferase family 4 protein [Candidatus Oleimicrobiaceae bacterium]
MRVTFVLPFTSLSGGTKVVLEHANWLADHGHAVTIVYPLLPYRFGERITSWRATWLQARGLAANLLHGQRVRWFPLRAELRCVPSVRDRFLPEADAVVATAWPTAYSVAALAANKGEKFYFVQGYETWRGPKQLVDGSYRLPLKQIVVSTWLERLMREQFAATVVGKVLNGVDHRVFFNPEKRLNQPRRVLLPYSRLPWKGTADGLAAMALLRRAHPEVQLVMYGLERGPDVPKDAEFHLRPTGERLRQLYCSCDVLLFPSRSEGFGLPPLEAMACKCAVVATRVGGIPDYTVEGETVLTVPPGDVEGLAAHLARLIADPQLLEKLSFAGCNYVAQFTQEQSSARLARTLQSNVATRAQS